MLEVIEYGKGEYEFPALVVLGCFDAIHAGHRDLLKKAKLQAKINGLDLGVMMFKEGKSGKLVYSFEERCAILEQFNVKFVLAVDFNEEFKAVAPLDFLHEVEEKINVKAYMSGKDFRFGAGAKGKSSTLKNYAEDEENGVWYMPVKDVDLNGEKISTTLIKTCLDQGDVAKANALLGAEFTVSGEVVKGEGRGTSQVGFPTVNIVYPEWKHPLKHGVYSVKCMVGDTDYQGIANFGTCPTFADERVALEVYLEGFSGDLYGQILTIRFIDYIRDIEEFGSAEELSGQLQNDLLTVADELAVTETEPTVVEPEPDETEEVVAGVEPVATEEVVEEVVPVEAEEVVAEAEPVAVEEVAVEEVIEEKLAEEPHEGQREEEHVETEDVEIKEHLSEDGLDEVMEPADEEVVAEEQLEEQEAETEEIIEEAIIEEPVEEAVEEVAVEEPVEEVAVEEQLEEQPVEEEQTEEPVEEITEEPVEAEQAEEPVDEEVTEEPEQYVEEIIEDTVGEEQTEEQPEQPAEEVVEEETEAEVIEEEQLDEPAEEAIEEAVVEEAVEETVAQEEVIEETETVYTDGEDIGDGEEN